MNEWHELEPLQPEAVPLREIFEEADLATIEALPGGTVIVLREAFTAMQAHAASSTLEVIGILRGRVLATDPILTVVTAADAIHEAHSEAAWVRTVAGNWPATWAATDSTLPVLGWYHSHPGFGIFFSETDHTTQRNYFQQPWAAGIVLDPVRKQAGAYLGPKSHPASIVVIDSLRA